MELVKKTSAALSGTIEDIRVKDGTLTVTVMDSVITVGDKTYSGIGRTLYMLVHRQKRAITEHWLQQNCT